MDVKFDLSMIDELISRDALNLLDTFGPAFTDAMQLPAGERKHSAMADVAAGVSETFRLMREQRRQVQESHPWRYGIMLVWLSQEVEVEGVKITPFSYFRSQGFWDEYKGWPDFATDQTGVSYGEWNNWMSVVRRVLLTENGQDVIAHAGMSPDEFIRNVPMGKAQRAVGAIGRGEMTDFKVAALIDPGTSEERLRHVLRQTREEYEAEQVVKAELDEKWLDRPTDSWHAEWDPVFRTLTLRGWRDGKPVSELLVRLPVPASDRVGLIHDRIVQVVLEEFKTL